MKINDDIGRISPVRVFLIIGLVFGAMFIIVTPPFQAPDEYHHMFRAYQISTGAIQPEVSEGIAGGVLPSSLGQTVLSVSKNILQHPQYEQRLVELNNTLAIELAPENVKFYHFPNTARYAPVMYVPQVVGIAIGRLLCLPPIALMYLGRAVNLAVWLLLIAAAIHAVPVCKWLFTLLALMPMSLFLAASFSADTFTNAIAFVFCALIFRAAYGNSEKVPYWELAVLIVVSIILTLSKQVYAPLILLFFLIPARKFGRYSAVAVLFFAVNIAAAVGWSLFMRGLAAPMRFDIVVSPEEQWAFITSHPLDYAVVMANTLIAHWHEWLEEFIGKLGWLDTELPGYVHKTYWAALILTAVGKSRDGVTVSAKDKVVVIAAVAAITFIIALSQYLTWTPVARSFIMGITGRYLIPLSPAIFILLHNNKINIDTDRRLFGIIMSCYLTVVMISTAAAMTLRYYL